MLPDLAGIAAFCAVLPVDLGAALIFKSVLADGGGEEVPLYLTVATTLFPEDETEKTTTEKLLQLFAPKGMVALVT